MDSMKLFWGLVVLSFGSLLLAINQGWLNSSIWWSILALWPIILIVIGLSLLVKNERVLSALIIGVVLLSAVFVALTYNNENRFMSFRRESSLVSEKLTDKYDSKAVKNLNLTLNTGAARVNISSMPEGESSDVLYVVETSDMGKMSEKKTVTDNTISLVIDEGNGGIHMGPQMITNREITLYLPTSPTLQLSLDSGASKLDIDLTNLNINKLDLNIGASSGDIYLGKNAKKQEIAMNAGASSVSFHVPTGLGVRATFDGGLNSINSDASLSITKNADTYTSKDFDTSTSQVVISGDAGVSSIRFEAR